MGKPSDRPVERDLRIDFLRGVALIIVLVDHVERINRLSLIQEWTPRSLGFSDGADLFVFLSGLTFGMVYSRRMDRHGFLFSFAKSARRSLQIYSVYLLTLAAVLLLGYALVSTAPLLGRRLQLDEPLSSQLLGGLILSNQPYGFQILSFYILVLPYATVLVWLQRRCPILAWAIALGLYGAVQFRPELNLQQFPGAGEWYFNPFAWQFLFFVGIAAGMKQAGCAQTRWFRVSLCSLALAVVVVGVICTKGLELCYGQISPLDGETIEWSASANKTTLGPLRVLHFLAVASLLFAILDKQSACLTRPVGKCLVMAGQHSLPVYSLGIFLTFVTIPIFTFFGPATAAIAIVHVDMVLLSIFFAWFRHSKSQRVMVSRRA
jgi:hypothetical protein